MKKFCSLLLLLTLSISVLPVKLLHRHNGEHSFFSYRHQGQGESLVAGNTAYCPVCLYTFIQHYLPGNAPQKVAVQPSAAFIHVPLTPPHRFGERIFHSLRGPPFC